MSRGRIVFVVGASSGIGRATAHRLAARGYHLVLAGRAAEPLAQTVAECSAAATVRAVPLDVCDEDALRRAVAGIIAEHGWLDAVVQSAGVVAYGRFEDIPREVFDRVLAVNVLGAANLARTVLPVLRAQRQGSVVLIGSLLGEVAVPTMSPYVVSKWAVRSLGRELALENRDLPGVHISVVSPGGVNTPIYQNAANFLGRPGRPPAPVDNPDRVARAVLRTLDRPRDRVSVGVANAVMRLGFTLLPRVFDRLVGPMFRFAALERRSVQPANGNVLAPVAPPESAQSSPSL